MDGAAISLWLTDCHCRGGARNEKPSPSANKNYHFPCLRPPWQKPRGHGRPRTPPVSAGIEQASRRASHGRRDFRGLRRPDGPEAHPRDLQPGRRQPPAAGVLPRRLRPEADPRPRVPGHCGLRHQAVLPEGASRPDIWNRIAANTSYVAGGYDEKAAFDRLAAHIAAIEKQTSREMQVLFYISTPPSVFEPIITNLGASGLGESTSARTTRRR